LTPAEAASPLAECPLMPGEQDVNALPVPRGADPDSVGVAMTFRDATGVSWRVRSGGALEDLSPMGHSAQMTSAITPPAVFDEENSH
jgi:hypothetical protein